MPLLDFINEFWKTAAVVVAGLTAIATYYNNRNKSNQQMLEIIEELKLQIIANIEKEIKQAAALAEKDKLLNDLRVNCPDCYNKYAANYQITLKETANADSN